VREAIVGRRFHGRYLAAVGRRDQSAGAG
jgi:hypothetical protein